MCLRRRHHDYPPSTWIPIKGFLCCTFSMRKKTGRKRSNPESNLEDWTELVEPMGHSRTRKMIFVLKQLRPIPKPRGPMSMSDDQVDYQYIHVAGSILIGKMSFYWHMGDNSGRICFVLFCHHKVINKMKTLIRMPTAVREFFFKLSLSTMPEFYAFLAALTAWIQWWKWICFQDGSYFSFASAGHDKRAIQWMGIYGWGGGESRNHQRREQEPFRQESRNHPTGDSMVQEWAASQDSRETPPISEQPWRNYISPVFQFAHL